MKRTNTTILAFMILAWWGCQSERQKTAMEKVPGVWIEIGSPHPFIEIWTQEPDKTFHGRGGQIKEADTIFFEELIISNINGQQYYQAILPDREPVNFLLIKSTPDYLEWFNPDNDYPGNISYFFIGNDTLRIILSGKEPSDTILMLRKKP